MIFRLHLHRLERIFFFSIKKVWRMIKTVRIAFAQINPTVGAIAKNTEHILAYIKKAQHKHANIILFPELAITGYPPEDLVLRDDFIEANLRGLRKIAAASKDLLVVTGFIEKISNSIHNSAAVCAGGELVTTYQKICLPNYGVFDERRYFIPGSKPVVLEWEGLKIGINVCEDIWTEAPVAEFEASVGQAHLLLNISASPYHFRKGLEREQLLARIAQRSKAFFAYVNLVGGQDELVFDGQAFLYDPNGRMLLRGRQFEEELIVADFSIDTALPRPNLNLENQYALRQARIAIPFNESASPAQQPSVTQARDDLDEVFSALVLGTRDYVHKNGFQKVTLGLSGGIDSALVAAIAVAALGKESVIGVLMPSRFTASMSVEDAEALASNLGIRTLTLPIKNIVTAFDKTLSQAFAELESDLTEENIQARIRGILLMALSNKFGWLVLTTSNKSETAVGYSTLYGDMAGGFAVIKDIPKTLIYQLTHWINRHAFDRPVIPQRTIERAPTAELREEQTDQDSLPPYEVLDRVIESYVEDDRGAKEMIAEGLPEQLVTRVIQMIDRAEYKRQQGPPGVKISVKSFDKDRRMPITNHFKPYELT